MLETKGAVSKDHRCFPIPFDKKLRKKKKYAKSDQKKVEKIRQYYDLFDTSIKSPDLKDNNLFICKNGEEWRTEEMNINLECYFIHHGDPFIKLGPFKLEEKNKDPFLVSFKDFLSHSEVLYLRGKAENNLQRSTFGRKEAHEINGIFRSSKQTWLQDRSYNLPSDYMEKNIPQGMENPYKDGYLMADNLAQVPVLPPNSRKYRQKMDPVAYKLTTRIQLATQFHLMGLFASEAYQIANYGLGGQYGTHYDSHGFLNPDQKRSIYAEAIGDRVATFMAYLSDVELGGSTSFPLLGIASEARLGDAVFWINTQSSGLLNPLTAHAGCPVIVGNKWIANKWIFYFDQYEKFKCSLNSKTDSFEAFQKYRYQNLSIGDFFMR